MCANCVSGHKKAASQRDAEKAKKDVPEATSPAKAAPAAAAEGTCTVSAMLCLRGVILFA